MGTLMAIPAIPAIPAKGALFTILLMLFLQSCSCMFPEKMGNEEPETTSDMRKPPAVSVVPARFAQWREEIPLLGTAFADSAYHLSLEESGKIKRIAVQVGDYVKQGETLIEVEIPDITQLLEAGELKARIADKHITLARLELQEKLEMITSSELLAKKREQKMSLLENERKKAVKNLAESQALFRAGTISQEELEKEEESLERIKASIEALEIDMEIGAHSRPGTAAKETELELRELEKAQLELGLQSLQRRMERSILTAPKEGIVSALFIGEEEMAKSGQRVVHLFDPTQIKIRVPVPNRYFSHLSEGNSVIFPSADKAASPLQGEVEAIIPQSDSDGRFSLIARGIQGGLPILPGSRHEVILESSKQIEGVLLEPEMIIDREGGESHLLLLQDDRLLFRSVRTTETENGFIWITEGLVEGDLICTSLPPLFHEGMSARPDLSSGLSPFQGGIDE